MTDKQNKTELGFRTFLVTGELEEYGTLVFPRIICNHFKKTFLNDKPIPLMTPGEVIEVIEIGAVTKMKSALEEIYKHTSDYETERLAREGLGLKCQEPTNP